MSVIVIHTEAARLAYKEADENGKKLLSNLIGKKVLFDRIIDVVDSYEEACQIKGITPLSIDQFSMFPENQREYLFAVHQLITISEVINEGWVPDYANTNQRKYYPWFEWKKLSAGGSGFSYGDYYIDRSFSTVGARLSYETAEKAEYAGTKFIHLYRIFLNP